jgi:nifR3 family TIM-barrel protein
MSCSLKPFHIGAIRIEHPVVLAALSGYSDLAYRRICRQHGAEYCTTEMLLDKSVLVKGKLRQRLLRIGHDEHPVAGQLIGNDSRTMAEAAAVLCETGFDVVDLNFACPVRKALSRRRGGYLLQQPSCALEIVCAVVAASVRPVTLKLRRKFKTADGEDNFWRIAEGAFEAGAAAICVHARSVEEKYAGKADWGFIERVKARFPHSTIIGSGDVLEPADALAMLDRTGVDAVAVARGALGNPWFFRQVRELADGREPHRPGIDEQRELLSTHFAAACELYGPVTGPKIMRKFGVKYARTHPSPRAARAAFVKVKTPADWQKALDEFYGDGQDMAGNIASP